MEGCKNAGQGGFFARMRFIFPTYPFLFANIFPGCKTEHTISFFPLHFLSLWLLSLSRFSFNFYLYTLCTPTTPSPFFPLTRPPPTPAPNRGEGVHFYFALYITLCPSKNFSHKFLYLISFSFFCSSIFPLLNIPLQENNFGKAKTTKLNKKDEIWKGRQSRYLIYVRRRSPQGSYHHVYIFSLFFFFFNLYASVSAKQFAVICHYQDHNPPESRLQPQEISMF